MLNRRQAITWTNADLIHWHIYAALGGDELNWNILGKLGQYHCCWCPGDLHYQVISSHGIDYAGWTDVCHLWEWVWTTCTFSVLRNDKYANTYLFVINSPPPSAVYASVNLVSIASGNVLSPVQRQAVIYTNTDSLSIGPLGTAFSEIRIKIPNFSFTKKCIWKCCLRNGGHFIQGEMN